MSEFWNKNTLEEVDKNTISPSEKLSNELNKSISVQLSKDELSDVWNALKFLNEKLHTKNL